jgi:hypothetical protein
VLTLSYILLQARAALPTLKIVEKEQLFRRDVVQRHTDDPLHSKYLDPFPSEHWFWCYPASDSSSSLKGHKTLCTYQYKALKRLYVVDAASLFLFLAPQYSRDLQVFVSMGHKVHESRVSNALLPSVAKQGMIGIHRRIGSGEEFVFFSLTAQQKLAVIDV